MMPRIPLLIGKPPVRYLYIACTGSQRLGIKQEAPLLLYSYLSRNPAK